MSAKETFCIGCPFPQLRRRLGGHVNELIVCVSHIVTFPQIEVFTVVIVECVGPPMYKLTKQNFLCCWKNCSLDCIICDSIDPYFIFLMQHCLLAPLFQQTELGATQVVLTYHAYISANTANNRVITISKNTQIIIFLHPQLQC